MKNTVQVITKRLRAHTMPTLSTFSRQTAFSTNINMTALKQQTAHWEPNLNLKDLLALENQDSDNNANKEENHFHMLTFTTFDPGASHPLLLSSALSLSVSSLAPVELQRRTAPLLAQVQNPSTTSSLHHAIEVQQVQPACSTQPRFRPWPYSLPKALQPKAGTTYDLTYGDGVGGGPVGKVKLSVLQKVLYGVPEPGEEGSGEGELK